MLQQQKDVDMFESSIINQSHTLYDNISFKTSPSVSPVYFAASTSELLLL